MFLVDLARYQGFERDVWVSNRSCKDQRDDSQQSNRVDEYTHHSKPETKPEVRVEERFTTLSRDE